MPTRLLDTLFGQGPSWASRFQRVATADELVAATLFIDVEADRTRRLYSVGAVRGDAEFRWAATDAKAALAGVGALAEGARWIAGHNLIAHDLPLLRKAAPGVAAWDLAAVDTLLLSPLAFPANPYHRLVKDYKLVGDAVNDPVADARLARDVLRDALDAVVRLARAEPAAAAFHRFALDGGGRGGMADLLGRLGVAKPRSPGEALDGWLRVAGERVCATARRRLDAGALDDPDGRLAYAYVLAWLGVAGTNSVLPGWVRHSHPETLRLIRALRDAACDDPACRWCRTAYDAVHWLGQTFGYAAYRTEPVAPDGSGLQQRVVEAGLAGRPLLAVLPTGGGKSLCFQVPAIARHHRTGALTVVVSPLQALMKDQVENLGAKTGRLAGDALYGSLTLPERGAVMERVRLGDTALLYVSPEQLRNPSVVRVLESRTIGAWVFDEAHCLSHWGHDFRPDYLYVARFIRDLAGRQREPPPPVAGFTATARADVIDEIRAHFRGMLGQDLALFQGGVDRPNLAYTVEAVAPQKKVERIAGLLRDHVPPGAAAAIVYAATRRRTEEVAAALAEQGWHAAAFHAGLSAARRQEVQAAFVAGTLRVVVATNAFGMGIDKDSVRLVVHAEVPGSLEAYVQEAGRAGRDREPAVCVLLYDPEDLETQFRLAARSQLGQRDVAQILRGVRALARRLGGRDRVVATPGELMAADDLELGFQAEDADADTKVKTALAWLERAGLLARDENLTWVVGARPRLSGVAEVRRVTEALGLPAPKAETWIAVFRVLVAAAGDGTEEERTLTVDELARLPALQAEVHDRPPHEAARRVLSIIDQMATAGLVDRGTTLTAQVRLGGSGASRRVLERMGAMAGALLDVAREAEPDGGPVALPLRAAARRLRDQGHADARPDDVRALVRVLSHAERGRTAAVPRLRIIRGMLGEWRVQPTGPWDELAASLKRRLAVAAVVLDRLAGAARATESATGALVPFTLEAVAAAVRADMVLAAEVPDPLEAVTGACLLLHDWRSILLQGGLSVFRQGMVLRLPAEAKGKRYGKTDHEALAAHYAARTVQIHAMGEYARRGLAHPDGARAFAADYFSLPAAALARRHFAGRVDELGRPVAGEMFAAIVTALGNPAQQSIVTAPVDANLLVLAGPGSGKTRVIVHRCAYLLRVCRVPATAVLVLCFNRAAALSVRRRLRDLVGVEAAQVDVHTYHGLAMRLVGATFAERLERRPDVDGRRAFDDVIRDATALLRGEGGDPGMDAGDVRERLLARYRYILIDEYQDIDGDQYDLVSAIAGRQEADPDARIALMAVGDDDQGVYAFRGASVEYIRRFREDYGARTEFLVENYRSTAAIIAAAGAVIAANRDRMKAGNPVCVDRARMADPPGEPVRLLSVAGPAHQLAAALAEVRRRVATGGAEGVAVLAFARTELAPFHALCRKEGVPVDAAYDKELADAFPPHRLREVGVLLDRVAAARRRLDPGVLRRWIAWRRRAAPSPWWALCERILDEAALSPGDGASTADGLREHLYEALAQIRRERGSGRGVFVGTLHGAKGLEFEHVVILDGGQGAADEAPADAEEGRRVFYVGMTRARRSLTLLTRADRKRPAHADLLDGLPLERLRPPDDGMAMAAAVLGFRREILGLGDLFIDFAGLQPPTAAIHAALARLRPGAPLRLIPDGRGNLVFGTADGVPVARIAKGRLVYWRATAAAVDRARVVGLVRRFATDTAPTYRDRLNAEAWEVPIIEVWTRAAH